MEPEKEVFTPDESTRSLNVSKKLSFRHPRDGGTRHPEVASNVTVAPPQIAEVTHDDMSAVKGVYLDYNGSTPIDPRAAEVMVAALTEGTGNASSAHRFGLRQAATVDAAREEVAALVGGRPSNVLFTASATEANNLALCGVVEGAPAGRARIVISAVEHASVRQTARWLDERGLAKLDILPVNEGGFVDLQAPDKCIVHGIENGTSK